MRACASELSLPYGISTPIRRTCPDCCARAASGQATAALPRSMMKCRRLMALGPHAEDHTLAYHRAREGVAHRRNISSSMSQTGQKPTLQSDRRISALPPKADVRVTHRHVRFGPHPDIRRIERPSRSPSNLAFVAAAKADYL